MNAKDKAQELVKLFLTVGKEVTYTECGKYEKTIPYSHAQVNAIILVDEMLREYKEQIVSIDTTIDVAYWNNVKQEIENL
jgi:hypothetical protein